MCQLSRLKWFRRVNHHHQLSQLIRKIVFKICLWTNLTLLHILLMSILSLLLILAILLMSFQMHKPLQITTQLHSLLALISHLSLLLASLTTYLYLLSMFLLIALYVPRPFLVRTASSQMHFQRNVLLCTICQLSVVRLTLRGKLRKLIQRQTNSKYHLTMLLVMWSKYNSIRSCVVCARTNIDKRLLWLVLTLLAIKIKRLSHVLARILMFLVFILVLLSSVILSVVYSLLLVLCSTLVKTSFQLRA